MQAEKLKQLGIIVPEKVVQLLTKFQKMVLEQNQLMNLTAITDPDEFTVKHLADSLSVLAIPALRDSARVLDVGTGAGFPGIPLAAAAPDKQFVLIDSLQKRVRFVKQCIVELGLSNVEVRHARAEELAKEPDYRERFDCVVSRAVAELNILSEYCLPFAALKGHFLAMKGPAVDEEIANAEYAIQTLGGRIAEVLELNLEGFTRTVVVIEKESTTPPQYPRRAGIPKKRPLVARGS